MRIPFLATLGAIALLASIAGTASGQMKCGFVVPPNATIHDRVGPSYQAVLAKYGIRPGEAFRASPSRPDVKFAEMYEFLLDGERRAKEAEEAAATIIRQLDETQRAARRIGVSGGDPGVPDVFGPAMTGAEFDQAMNKIHARRLAIKAELERRADVVQAAFLVACKAEKESDGIPPAGALIAISGTWTAMKFTYTITQSIKGDTFTWKNADLAENATGTIKGTEVTASWKGRMGEGSATGHIIADRNNYAIRIEWSNGVVFVRK